MLTSRTVKSTTHVYYDVSYQNTLSTLQLAKLFDNRSSALLDNPSDYYYSCVRFNIPTAYLPLFIYPNNGSVADNTQYRVSIHYFGGGADTPYQAYINYVPASNYTNKDPNYFFVYSFNQFLDAINTAYNTAYLALKTAHPGATVSSPPFMTYDASTGLFAMVADKNYATSDYKIYMNDNLYAFFDNFYVYRTRSPAVSGEEVQFIIKNTGENDYSTYPPGYSTLTACYRMVQEYDSRFNWYDVRSIVFVSNTLNVADEAINITKAGVPNSGNTYQKILTDFQLDIDQVPRSYLAYVPPGEYRLIDLKSTQPLVMFDVQIFFKTGTNELYPLYIEPGEVLDIKNMFRRRDYNGRF